MKSSNFLVLAIVLASPAANAQATSLTTPEELIRKLSGTPGSVQIRARLTVTDASSERRTAAQIQVKKRRDAGVTRLLFQVLWPPSHKAEALYIERSRQGSITGFLFEPPDKVTPITPAVLGRPYLDSDLSVEDLAEDFWQWPSQKIGGEEKIRGELCPILESRPPAGMKTSYALIRTWVSPQKALPLRIEKFGPENRLAKSFNITKTLRHDKAWAPMVTVVQTAGKTRQTTLEISRGDQHARFPLDDFSLEKIKKFAQHAARDSQ